MTFLCCLCTEMDGPCSEAETEQVEEGSTLVSPTSTSLRDDSSCVADVTDDSPGASRHHLPHEQVSISATVETTLATAATKMYSTF